MSRIDCVCVFNHSAVGFVKRHSIKNFYFNRLNNACISNQGLATYYSLYDCVARTALNDHDVEVWHFYKEIDPLFILPHKLYFEQIVCSL